MISTLTPPSLVAWWRSCPAGMVVGSAKRSSQLAKRAKVMPANVVGRAVLVHVLKPLELEMNPLVQAYSAGLVTRALVTELVNRYTLSSPSPRGVPEVLMSVKDPPALQEIAKPGGQ